MKGGEFQSSRLLIISNNMTKDIKSTRQLLPSLHGRGLGWVFCFLTLTLCSCSENEEYDPYYDWEIRNIAWFEIVADSARTAINAAREQYGDAWEEHTEWRMYKSLMKSPSFQSWKTEDSICVRIVKEGTGDKRPIYTDVVKVAYRGWLIPAWDANGNVFEKVFDQTFYGTFDEKTAAYAENMVSVFTEGFATALQYMNEGAEWIVYIPSELFYGADEQGSVPAYSAARFRIMLMKID